jgi:hypothetical protein
MVNENRSPPSESDTHSDDLKGLGAAGVAATGKLPTTPVSVSSNIALVGTPFYCWRKGHVPSFDLTTVDGLNAAKFASGETFGAAAASVTLAAAAAVVPSVWNLWGLVPGVLRYFQHKDVPVSSSVSSPSKSPPVKNVTPDLQLKFAQAIIASGQKYGAKKVKITVDKDIGASLGASYVGASIKGQVDSGGKMHLEVEYK